MRQAGYIVLLENIRKMEEEHEKTHYKTWPSRNVFSLKGIIVKSI